LQFFGPTEGPTDLIRTTIKEREERE